MKNTFIVGANGAIGRLLVQQMKENGLNFTAGVRKQEQLDDLKANSINAKLIDLSGSVTDMVQAFAGADSIIFTAGSGGKTGDDMTLEIDLDGAVKTMEAAQIAGIKRYVMVSSVYADRRETVDSSAIRPYMIAKFYADRELRRSTLDYTILHPGYLTNDEGTGKIVVDDLSDNIKISRSDVAASLMHLVNDDKSIRKDHTIVNGDTEISQAL